MTPIPTYLLEEHHEAFAVWQFAVQGGVLPRANNVLLHVDEHADLGTPRFNRSLHDLGTHPADILDFTYRELNIGGFIIPAVYQGLYQEVYWVRQGQQWKGAGDSMYVRSYNNAGCKLISGKVHDLPVALSGLPRREFTCHRTGPADLPAPAPGLGVALDIDLDFFSCAGNPNELEEIYVEITRQEYDRFRSNPYHRLHYAGLGRVEAEAEGGRYYYVLNNYEEIYPNPLRVTESQIVGRIEQLVGVLARHRVQPALITVCRSRHSGFTPADQWAFIEQTLLERLRGLYPLAVRTLQDLHPAGEPAG